MKRVFIIITAMLTLTLSAALAGQDEARASVLS
jgi:hypothetical protein